MQSNLGELSHANAPSDIFVRSSFLLEIVLKLRVAMAD